MKCTHCGYDPLEAMVWIVRALGDGVKRPMPCEMGNRVTGRKSVTALVDMPKGTRITGRIVGNRRPCPKGALPPKDLVWVVGQRTTRDVMAGESFFPDMVRDG